MSDDRTMTTLELLKWFEGDAWGRCFFCKQRAVLDQRHKPDCPLAAAIRREESGDKGPVILDSLAILDRLRDMGYDDLVEKATAFVVAKHRQSVPQRPKERAR